MGLIRTMAGAFEREREGGRQGLLFLTHAALLRSLSRNEGFGDDFRYLRARASVGSGRVGRSCGGSPGADQEREGGKEGDLWALSLFSGDQEGVEEVTRVRVCLCMSDPKA